MSCSDEAGEVRRRRKVDGVSLRSPCGVEGQFVGGPLVGETDGARSGQAGAQGQRQRNVAEIKNMVFFLYAVESMFRVSPTDTTWLRLNLPRLITNNFRRSRICQARQLASESSRVEWRQQSLLDVSSVHSWGAEKARM